jgi:hypothetical protein
MERSGRVQTAGGQGASGNARVTSACHFLIDHGPGYFTSWNGMFMKSPSAFFLLL